MAAKKAEQALVEQWRDMLALHARTQCELDRALHQHGVCASDFEVLDVLADGRRATGGGCSYRVQEIAERALSGLVSRMIACSTPRHAFAPRSSRDCTVCVTLT